nr:hypothetical protein [Methanobrevibacter arboriphilus]
MGGAVIIGFILAVIVKSLALGWGGLETIGLLIIGFIVGYIAKEGGFRRNG